MIPDDHFRKLERLYLEAPVNSFYDPWIDIRERSAEISIRVDPKFFHAGGAVHGSVCFKLLDDACYFSCQSVEPEYFLVTASFSIQYVAPVTSGTLSARATLAAAMKNVHFARGDVFDENGRIVASGSGTFMRSRLRLWTDVGCR